MDSPQLACKACQLMFDVDGDTEQLKVQCPRCGSTNISLDTPRPARPYALSEHDRRLLRALHIRADC